MAMIITTPNQHFFLHSNLYLFNVQFLMLFVQRTIKCYTLNNKKSQIIPIFDGLFTILFDFMYRYLFAKISFAIDII